MQIYFRHQNSEFEMDLILFNIVHFVIKLFNPGESITVQGQL